MQQVQPLQPGFSTADAGYPELRLAGPVLHLAFKDWKEQLVKVQFSDVCAFRWQQAEELLPSEPYDGSCVVVESEWLARHVTQGEVPPDSSHRHLRFNFNACGQLEVLCVSFSIVA
jgi:hypothetical protein